MRLIHTADWHLGNEMHDVDRRAEQKAFLDWLVVKIQELEADTLMVSGDIFDVKSPKIEAEVLYYNFLSRLDETPCKNVLIIGGNHDSGKRLEAPRSLVKKLNIHVVGTALGKTPENMVFELKDEKDQTYAVAVAVPYMQEAELRNYYDEDCAEGTFSDLAYKALFEQCREKAVAIRGERSIPIIAMNHLYAAGLEGRYQDKEEETATEDGVRILDVVGNLGKVHADVFPRDFDYVGLGHIHYTTRVDKNDRIRYSGSPFVMGYDDALIEHCILCVNIDKAADHLQVSPISVPRTVQYRRLSGTKDKILGDLQEILNQYAGEEDIPLYLELRYPASEGGLLQDAVEGLDWPRGVEIVSWKAVLEKEGDSGMFREGCDIKDLASIDLESIVRHLVLTKNPIPEDKKEGRSQEEIRQMEDELVYKYLPYFREALNAVEVNGDENTED